MQEYQTTVIKKQQLNSNVVELELSRPDGFTFQAGQYVGFQMEYTARSYSMVSTPDESTLRFCIKIIEDGIGSEYVNSLKVGDEVFISGPFGKFTMDNASSDVLFVATGVGIAPIVSLIHFLFKQDFNKNGFFKGLEGDPNFLALLN